MGCDTGQFTLKFNGSSVGDFLVSVRCVAKLVEEVRVRHNYWASSGLIDAAYPALIWETTAEIYKASTDSTDARAKALLDYASLTDLYSTGLAALGVWLDSTQLLTFGNCAINDVQLSEPSQFLFYPVGVYSLTFLGTSKPATP